MQNSRTMKTGMILLRMSGNSYQRKPKINLKRLSIKKISNMRKNCKNGGRNTMLAKPTRRKRNPRRRKMLMMNKLNLRRVKAKRRRKMTKKLARKKKIASAKSRKSWMNRRSSMSRRS